MSDQSKALRVLQVACVAMTLAVSACGGGGGSPTAPPAPPAPPADLSGDWTATEELVRGEPAGNCWADFLTSQAGARASFATEITQSGNAATVVINPSDPSTFSGTWNGTRLQAAEQGAGGEVDVTCPDGTTFTARHVAGGQLDVTGSTASLSGTLSEVFDLIDAQGAGAGQITAHYSLQLAR